MSTIAGRKVYAPPLDERHYPLEADNGERKRRVLIGVIMGVVVLALGAVSWNLYGGGRPMLIQAPAGYKTPAPPPPDHAGEAREVYRLMEGGGAPAPLQTVAAPARLAAPAPIDLHPGAPPASGIGLAVAPSQPTSAHFAQLAALRSEAAAQAAWAELAARAPGLLGGAQMNIQRADLGAQGVFYRLRAGGFADRESAGAFCERAKSAGVACMVVTR